MAFRFFAERYAHSLRLTGWVRNVYDGRVEVLAEGERGDLEVFLGRLKEGPRMARVDNLDVEWGDYTGEFPDFEITHSLY